MGKKIMTLDNLYQFFVQQNQTVKFNANESGSPIVVTTNGYFSNDSTDDMPGMMKLKFKVCHTDTNRNGSHISQANMEKAMPTLKYRPILAHIHELEDGTKDFYAHNIEIIENENGEEEIVYTEKQVGCFTADDPWLEYDKDMDKTYVMAYGVVPEEYTETADIIRRKNGTKVSCELVINELSYNAKEKYLDLVDFYFGGVTLLGCDEDGNEIGEGMLGSRAYDIADFCHKEPVFNYQDKLLIEVLDKLNNTLSNFNINQSKSEEEGGDEEMDQFEETVVETTEVEEVENTEEVVETESETEEVESIEEETVTEAASDSDDGDSEQIEEKFTKVTVELSHDDIRSALYNLIELSHDDIRLALYNLISVYNEEDNECYGIYEVYDTYFVMQGWCAGKFFKQNYVIDGENVSLSGDRQEVFMMLLTESEKLEVEDMRKNYAALKEFKDNYDAQQIMVQKNEVFSREEYAEIAETDDFKEIVSNMDQYSVKELEIKCDLLFAAYAKSKHKNFAIDGNDKKSTCMRFNVTTQDKTNEKPYGDLFN